MIKYKRFSNKPIVFIDILLSNVMFSCAIRQIYDIDWEKWNYITLTYVRPCLVEMGTREDRPRGIYIWSNMFRGIIRILGILMKYWKHKLQKWRSIPEVSFFIYFQKHIPGTLSDSKCSVIFCTYWWSKWNITGYKIYIKIIYSVRTQL